MLGLRVLSHHLRALLTEIEDCACKGEIEISLEL